MNDTREAASVQTAIVGVQKITTGVPVPYIVTSKFSYQVTVILVVYANATVIGNAKFNPTIKKTRS